MVQELLDYWEGNTPMSFVDGIPKTYEEKRRFRYNLQDYMHVAFGFWNYCGMLVLDLGCGAGIDSAEFARYGAGVVSVDPTKQATYCTRDLFKEARLDGDVVRACGQYLPFQPDLFGCVYSFGVLHHIPDVENVLGEIKRVLVPSEGKFMGMVYHRGSLLYAYSTIHGIPFERIPGCPYVKAYSKEEALNFFSHWFEDVEVQVQYNVIDTKKDRKVKVGVPEGCDLGWHLVVKGTKNEQA